MVGLLLEQMQPTPPPDDNSKPPMYKRARCTSSAALEFVLSKHKTHYEHDISEVRLTKVDCTTAEIHGRATQSQNECTLSTQISLLFCTTSSAWPCYNCLTTLRHIATGKPPSTTDSNTAVTQQLYFEIVYSKLGPTCTYLQHSLFPRDSACATQQACHSRLTRQCTAASSSSAQTARRVF
jgi:hypothetical protein